MHSPETQKSDLLISIVSPVADAETYIEDYVCEAVALLERHFKDYEIVLVDNGSNDDTVARIEALQRQVKNVQLYQLIRPIAEDSAYVVGLEHAIGDLVVTVDSRSDPLASVMEMVGVAQSGIDVVYGLCADRRAGRSVYDRLAKRFFRGYGKLTGQDFPSDASTLRLFTRRALNAVLDNPDRYEIFTVLPVYSGLPYQALVYERSERRGAAPRGRRKLFEGFSHAARLLFLTSDKPLRLLSVSALLGACINILYSLYVFAIALFKPHVAEGWVSLSLQISSMFLLVFVVLAILCEYVVRLFMHNQARPFYVIAKESSSLVLTRKRDLNVVHDTRVR